MFGKNGVQLTVGILLVLGADPASPQTPAQRDPGDIRGSAETLAEKRALFEAFRAGTSALRAKEYEQAVASFTLASQLDASEGVIWADLGESLLGLFGTKTGSERDQAMDQALSAYGKAVSLMPADAAFHNNYGLALARAKRFDESTKEIGSALRLDSGSAGKYYFTLGAIAITAGRNDDALASFKASTEAGNLEAYFQYGLLLMGKAVVGPSGRIAPPPGTVEALQTYVRLVPGGRSIRQACSILVMMGSANGTNCQNPQALAPRPATPAESAGIGASVNNVREEIDRVYLSGSYVPLPTIRPASPNLGTGNPPTAGGVASMSVLDVKNDTAYTLTTLFSGPAERRVDVGPGGSVSVELSPGTYKVVGRVNAPDVQSSYGEHVFESGRSGIEFYIQ